MAESTLPPPINAVAPAAMPSFRNFLREDKLFFIPGLFYLLTIIFTGFYALKPTT
jgi:hypothetical protein